jgi:aminoglycoside phosphotransferase family enzyme
LYLEVLPVTGSVEAPQMGGDGPAIEYVLKMRQFPQSGLLSTLQANGELTTSTSTRWPSRLRASTSRTKSPGRTRRRHPGQRDGAGEQNFEQILPFLSDKNDLLQLEALKAWAESSFERLKPLFAHRKAEGFTRECHGDIHLGQRHADRRQSGNFRLHRIQRAVPLH